MPEVDGSLPALLHRLRVGSRWLTGRDEELDRLGQTYSGKFARMLDVWYGLDAGLRAVHGYVHCVFGEGQSCPEDAAVFCQACGEGRPRA